MTLLLLVLEPGSLTGLRLSNWVWLAGQGTLKFTHLFLPRAGITTMCHQTGLFNVGSRDKMLVLLLAPQVLYQLNHLPSLRGCKLL